MLEYARWKYVVILLVLLVSVLYALPNIYPQDPSVQVTANRGSVVDAAMQARVDATLKKVGVRPRHRDLEGRQPARPPADPNVQIKAADAIRERAGQRLRRRAQPRLHRAGLAEKIGAKPMLLGLDLQGGVHFLMQVDQQAALAKRFDATAEDVRVLLRENGVAYTSVERRPTTHRRHARHQRRSGEGAPLIAKHLPTCCRRRQPGNRIVLRVPQAELDRVATEAIEQNVSTLRNRINELGVAEPIIQRQGTDRVVVQLPGVQDTAQAKRILGATATLEFRGVYEGGDLQEAVTKNDRPAGRAPVLHARQARTSPPRRCC
jgi:preprotein translocase subunit SecD